MQTPGFLSALRTKEPCFTHVMALSLGAGQVEPREPLAKLKGKPCRAADGTSG